VNRPLSEGDRAPAFEATDHTGRVWRMSELAGRWVVVFFYPRDFSPVCTAQSCAFRDSTPRLLAKGAVVLGVSGDGAESHRRFAEMHSLPYPLVSDPDGSLTRAFGVKRGLLGLLPGRATFVINPAGVVAMVYRSALQGKEHATRALAVVEGGVRGM
jgi:thioredoxin-dependent peroxiredoxin